MPAQTLAANEYITVGLNGGISSDSDGIIVQYGWLQVSGPAVDLQNAATVTPTFVTPIINTPTNLEFRLVVTDDLGAQDK